MLKVGLTGGIGSGKSTVSNMLRQKNIAVIDADIVAREILNIYPQINEEIKREFGIKYFDEFGNLKRRELGNYIFKDKVRKEKLEAIMLPYIIKEIFARLDQYNSEGEKLCIVDAPTLIEAKLHKAMDVNILVWVDLETQIGRIKNRDLLENENVIARIKSQMPLDEKVKFVDFLIDNRGELESTKEQLDEILKKLHEYEVKK